MIRKFTVEVEIDEASPFHSIALRVKRTLEKTAWFGSVNVIETTKTPEKFTEDYYGKGGRGAD